MDEKKNEETEKKNQAEPAKPRRKTRKTTAGNTQSKEQKSDKNEEKSTSTKEKEHSNLDDSIAYLKEIGLKKVSNKTFINEIDLAAFLDGDFANINKTRAFGFIQILEREFPVKLDELKKAYLAQYQQNKKEKTEVVVQSKVDEDFVWKKYIVRSIPVLLLLFGVWYFATRDNSALSQLESEQNIVSTDINNNVVTEAEKNLTQYENKQVDFPEEAEIIDSPRVSPFRRGEIPAKTVAANSAVTENNNTGTNTSAVTSDDLDLDLMVKQMVQEYNLTLEDNNDTDLKKPQEEEEESTVAAVAKQAPVKAIKKKETTTKKSKVVEKKEKEVVEKGKKKSVSKKVINSKLYIVPRRKSWVGITYLDDYSKKDFLIRKPLRLNSTRPQLIVVGQKEFEIFNNGYSYRFRGKGPVRFIYKNGDIMEITYREFKKYSKGPDR